MSLYGSLRRRCREYFENATALVFFGARGFEFRVGQDWGLGLLLVQGFEANMLKVRVLEFEATVCFGPVLRRPL